MTDYAGNCLCGAIEFTVEIETPEVGKCNCGMCRQWAAGPTHMVHGALTPKVADESNLGVYDSSDWGQRCFCKQCGTVLFWKHKHENFCGVSVDALKGAEGFELSSEIFIDKIPASHIVTDKTNRMTEKEFFDILMQGTENA